MFNRSEKRLRKNLQVLVDRARANGIPLSKMPDHLDSMMQNNGVAEERRVLVRNIVEDYLRRCKYTLIA